MVATLGPRHLGPCSERSKQGHAAVIDCVEGMSSGNLQRRAIWYRVYAGVGAPEQSRRR